MVGVLLRDVASALRDGGAFYCNGIVNDGTRSATDEENMRGGSASHDLRELQVLAQGSGLTVVGSHSYRMEVPQIDVWVARLLK
jgi:hypothetical protein